MDVSAGGEFPSGGFDGGDSEVYALRVAQRRVVRLETGDGRGGCPGDTTLLVTRGGEQVAADDDGGAAACSLIERALDPGDYRVTVNEYNSGALPPYVLTVSFP